MAEATLAMLFDRLATRGAGAYGLSEVTQLEHALQSAALAAEENRGDGFVIAALFHDVGHLVADEDVDLAAQGIDDRHEEASADVLLPLFGPEVAEPVRLHVASKRYLCTVEPDYYGKLSADSVTSLELQGGLMNDAERRAFEALPGCEAGVALRRIDDAAKVPGLNVPGLEHYREMAERVLV